MVRYLPLLALLTLACGKSESMLEPVPSVVASFVASQGLPKVQTINNVLNDPQHGLTVFRVAYGDPVPPLGLCVGSCPPVYRRAVGIRLERKVGWLEGLDSSRYPFFDVSVTDLYLFTEDLFTKFGKSEPILFQQPFKALLASDRDTPDEGLWLIVHGLSTWISPWIGGLLLDNPRVVANKEMLKAIAQLPGYEGDAYAVVRQRARQLLAAA